MQKIHDEIFELLLYYNKQNPEFRFSVRKSNRNARLNDGYWFYGNENYLAVSFWTGMDWKNRTPNIIFVILPNGHTYLETNTSDSDIKFKFITEFIAPKIKLEGESSRRKKHYSEFGNNYTESLKSFILNDKIRIDDIIKKHFVFFGNDDYNKIDFINNTDFQFTIHKIIDYRNAFYSTIKQTNIYKSELVKLNSVFIKNYLPIKEFKITNIPNETQWIFLTGENGTGKTSILKAISTLLCVKKFSLSEKRNFKGGEISLSFYDSNNNIKTLTYFPKEANNNEKPIIMGFAAYGASRLRTNHSGLSETQLKQAQKKTTLLSSLFNNDPILLDIQNKIIDWHKENSTKKRVDFIREVLISILPNLYDIRFDKLNEFDITYYIERDESGHELPPVTYDKLASGLKSLIGMIGDLMIRLFEQQPETNDPSEFKGIVIIDEIDIHLHPKFQKRLVEELTNTFPEIQFIATTHSPIPLLGAPSNSKIYLIQRNKTDGVTAKEFNEIDFKNLLPNTLLTSPLFGLETIRPNSNEDIGLINVDDNWKETKFFDLVDKKLAELEAKGKDDLNKYFSEDDKS